jgi:hypothetical protein
MTRDLISQLTHAATTRLKALSPLSYERNRTPLLHCHEPAIWAPVRLVAFSSRVQLDCLPPQGRHRLRTFLLVI